MDKFVTPTNYDSNNMVNCQQKSQQNSSPPLFLSRKGIREMEGEVSE